MGGLLNRGNTPSVTLRKPLPINNVSVASTIVSRTDTITISAGAAGTKGSFMLSLAPIASNLGDLVANFNDKSLSITSTALTTEVPFEQVMARASANQNQNLVGENIPDYKTYLQNGEFYVIYETGRVFYSKADTSTAVSAAYSVRVGSSSSGSTGATSTTTGFTNAIPETIYRTTAITKVDGQVSPFESNSRADLNTNLNTQIAFEDLVNKVGRVETQMEPTNLTASGLVRTGACRVAGFVVNSAAAGATIKIWNQTTAAGPVLLNTIPYTAAVNQGPSVVNIPGNAGICTNGCYVTISGIMDVTVFTAQAFNQ